MEADRAKESYRAAVQRRHEAALEEREALLQRREEREVLLQRREESLNLREAGLEKHDSVLLHREAMCRKRENSVRIRELDALGYDKRNKRTARQLEVEEEVVLRKWKRVEEEEVARKRRRVEEEQRAWDAAASVASKCLRNIA